MWKVSMIPTRLWSIFIRTSPPWEYIIKQYTLWSLVYIPTFIVCVGSQCFVGIWRAWYIVTAWKCISYLNKTIDILDKQPARFDMDRNIRIHTKGIYSNVTFHIKTLIKISNCSLIVITEVITITQGTWLVKGRKAENTKIRLAHLM